MSHWVDSYHCSCGFIKKETGFIKDKKSRSYCTVCGRNYKIDDSIQITIDYGSGDTMSQLDDKTILDVMNEAMTPCADKDTEFPCQSCGLKLMSKVRVNDKYYIFVCNDFEDCGKFHTLKRGN